MSDLLITLAIVLPCVLIWSSLVDLGITMLGPRPLKEFYRRKEAERIEVMRGLPRWKVVVIEGVVNFGLLMAVVFILLDYVRSRYEPEHRFHVGVIPGYLVIFISGGIWAGYRSWNRIRQRRFDAPPGRIGSSAPR